MYYYHSEDYMKLSFFFFLTLTKAVQFYLRLLKISKMTGLLKCILAFL